MIFLFYHHDHRYSNSFIEVLERRGREPRALRHVCQQPWPAGEPLDTPCAEGEEKGKAE